MSQETSFSNTISSIINNGCITTSNTTTSIPYQQLYSNIGTATPYTISIDADQIRWNYGSETPINKKGEENKMNFSFGTCENNNIQMSMYGLAVKNNEGIWVSYDKENKNLINVDALNIQGSGKYIFKMPVAIKDVEEGDIILHNKIPMFVLKKIDVIEDPESTSKSVQFDAIDPVNGEIKTILPTKSPFGFDFMTKIISMFNFGKNVANEENPFGDMMPWILMSNDGISTDNLLLMTLMNGQKDMKNNPMMLYLLFNNSRKG